MLINTTINKNQSIQPFHISLWNVNPAKNNLVNMYFSILSQIEYL